MVCLACYVSIVSVLFVVVWGFLCSVRGCYVSVLGCCWGVCFSCYGVVMFQLLGCCL